MNAYHQNSIRTSAAREFQRARRHAALENILSRLRGTSPDLLPYEIVRNTLKIERVHSPKVADIPLDAIVGSAGRYSDFTRTFRPRRDSTRDRWIGVKLALTRATGSLQPIEVYKIGDAYFVIDGHHRLSVLREQGATRVRAYVTELETNVPLTPEDDLEDVIVKAERAAFLACTGLDRHVAGAGLRMTVPGQYRVLEREIAGHRRHLEEQTGNPISYREAAYSWYDTVYRPVVRLICEHRLLHEFPEYTEADLYVCVIQHRQALQQRSERSVAYEDAIKEILGAFHDRIRRMVRKAGHFLQTFVRRQTVSGRRPCTDVGETYPCSG